MAFLPTLYKTKTQEIWQRQKKKKIIIEKLENATSDQFKQKLRGEYRIKHRKAKRATENEKKMDGKKSCRCRKGY